MRIYPFHTLKIIHKNWSMVKIDKKRSKQNKEPKLVLKKNTLNLLQHAKWGNDKIIFWPPSLIQSIRKQITWAMLDRYSYWAQQMSRNPHKAHQFLRLQNERITDRIKELTLESSRCWLSDGAHVIGRYAGNTTTSTPAEQTLIS